MSPDATAGLLAAVGLVAGAVTATVAGRRGGGPRIDWSGVPLLLVAALCALVRHAWPVALASGAVWVVGLALDARPARGHWRAGAVAALAFFLWASGVEIGSVKLPFSETFVRLAPWASAGITVLWVALASLAFSISGVLRGAVFGVGGVAALAFAAVCLLQRAATGPTALLLSASIAGAALGHALADRHAAGEGRAGGMTLGFLLGAVSVLGALKNTALLIGVLPVLLLGVPLLDATYAWTRRGHSGAAALAIDWRPARLHEVLLGRGYSVGQIKALFIAGAAFLSALAVVLVAVVQVHFAAKLALLVVMLPLGGFLSFCVSRLMPRRAAEAGPADRVELFDIPIHRVNMQQALDTIERFIQERGSHIVVTSDASALVRAQEDEELREIMVEADLVTADGAGIVAAARVLDIPLTERVSGCDLVGLICERAAGQGYRVYFLGAEPGIAEEAAAKLTAQYPGLPIAGCRNGYFTAEEEPAVVETIRAARPDVLFVAFGIPKQEKWIQRHRETLGVPVCIGVGGSFDVISGRVARAPKWMQRAGLEWLFRTLQRPTRWRRLTALPKLGWMTLKELVRPSRS